MFEPDQPTTAAPGNAPLEAQVPGRPLDLPANKLTAQIDNIVPTRGYEMMPMVALGGSAGSITPLREFFAAMPTDSGFAFVVILHLAPEHESMLADLLGRSTNMKVVQAEDGVEVEANCVYVIPPNKQLAAVDGHLQLSELEREHGRRVVVDLFFRSLADSHGPHSTAIVLSGADGDGALGIQRIKERGGLTIVQEPAQAEHSSMPRAAISTGMVDWVLPVAQMPGRILEYHQRERQLVLPPEEGPQPTITPIPVPSDEEKTLRDVLAFLRTRTGRDFSYYKRATILRRIGRRMQVNEVDDLAAYLVYLRTHPAEAGALLKDLLISVTNFFRDRDSFEALESRIPELFKNKGPGDTVRVWVAACATGEEAYSMAILLLEYARQLEAPPTLQVFGCDLDEQAIQTARAGIYPESITADVSQERLNNFFIREHEGYRVCREVREIVLFAAHDLLKDAPFSRLDLISCRNLLIYLNHDAQTRVFDIFHFSLRPEGRLFLGSSETVEDGSPLFSVLDKKHHIYVHHSMARLAPPLLSGHSTLSRSIQEHDRSRPVAPLFGSHFGQDAHWPFLAHSHQSHGERISWAALHSKMIERFAAPSIIVNGDHEIMHLSQNAGWFLQFSGGEPSTNLLRVVHANLRIELRAALFRASETHAPVDVHGISLPVNGVESVVDITVSPAQEAEANFLMVTFHRREPNGALTPTEVSDQQPILQHLERELEHTKLHLRDTVEQYEASTEELKASNEELQAMNEELRSATEELETSREELQSINEELTTVNQELKSKVDELAQTNSDLQNLMGSTAIATIFIDRSLRIMRYTPPAVGIFHLIPSDLGRPLTDLQYQIEYPELRADAECVLAKLAAIEREVSEPGGRCFLARVLPYRTTDDRIAGVVLTFVDISERNQAETALRQSQERLRLVVENAREYAIFSTDFERNITSWNSGAQRLLGYSEAEILGQRVDLIFTAEDRSAGVCLQEAKAVLAAGRVLDERWHLRKDGSQFWASGAMMLMHDSKGAACGFVRIFRDQTEERNASEALEAGRRKLWEALQDNQRARAEAEAAGRAKDQFLAVLSHELRTPLTPVLVAVHALARRSDLPPVVSEALAMIRRNVEMEAHFIDDLLDITRIARGKMEITTEPLDLHVAIEHAIDISKPDLAARHQHLELELGAIQHQVNGDGHRLQQVIWNLLKNASKFSPEGATIQLKSRNNTDKIVLSVCDPGVGMESGSLSRIFNPFEQADPDIARQFGGLGLGLAISKATIDAHGGLLKAESSGLGKGSTFSVELPVLPAPRLTEKKS